MDYWETLRLPWQILGTRRSPLAIGMGVAITMQSLTLAILSLIAGNDADSTWLLRLLSALLEPQSILAPAGLVAGLALAVSLALLALDALLIDSMDPRGPRGARIIWRRIPPIWGIGLLLWTGWGLSLALLAAPAVYVLRLEDAGVGWMLGAIVYALALAGLGLIAGLSLRAFQRLCNRAIVLENKRVREAFRQGALFIAHHPIQVLTTWILTQLLKAVATILGCMLAAGAALAVAAAAILGHRVAPWLGMTASALIALVGLAIVIAWDGLVTAYASGAWTALYRSVLDEERESL